MAVPNKAKRRYVVGTGAPGEHVCDFHNSYYFSVVALLEPCGCADTYASLLWQAAICIYRASSKLEVTLMPLCNVNVVLTPL
jgi:hypothetical protein